jgi:hypothetical protein
VYEGLLLPIHVGFPVTSSQETEFATPPPPVEPMKVTCPFSTLKYSSSNDATPKALYDAGGSDSIILSTVISSIA